jgi:hypothetical protein
MKYWQLFLVMSGIYVTPHLSVGVALALGGVMLVVGLYAMWRDM